MHRSAVTDPDEGVLRLTMVGAVAALGLALILVVAWVRSASSAAYCRSPAMIASMFRSASAVMVTKGLTPTLPGTREPSIT